MLEKMILDYKIHGSRVDEVLFHEVMKVLEKARKPEGQLDAKFMFINQGNEEQRYVKQERIIELENRVQELESRNNVLRSDLTANRNLYELAVKRSKRYREALEFYADTSNYDSWEYRSLYGDEPIHNVDMDHGEEARQALEEEK